MMRHLRLSTLVALFVVISAVAAAAAPYAYITNSGNGSVSLIDLSTNTVVATTIPVGASPFGVAMSQDGTRVYVANAFGGPAFSGTVSVISTLSDPPTVIGTITTGGFPFGVAVNPAGTLVYVARAGNGSVGVYSTSPPFQQVGLLISVGPVPRGVAVSPDGRYVVVSTGSGPTYAAVIDTQNGNSVDTIPNGGFVSGGFGVAISPDSTRAYVVRQSLDIVGVIDLTTDPASELTPVPVGDGPIGVALNADGTRLYVSNSFENSVSIVDLAGTGASQVVPVGGNPHGLSLNAGGDRLYVVNRGNGTPGTGTVSIVNLAANPPSVETVTMGSMPMSLGTFIHHPSSVDTAMQLSLSPGSVLVGSAGPVVFNATLSREDNGGPVSSAIVAFAVDGNSVGNMVTTSAGTASFSYNPSALAPGSHSVTATFAGSSNGTTFNGSSASGSFAVQYAFAWIRPTNGSTTGVNAGSTVPTRWTVTDANGAISDLRVVTDISSAPCSSGSSIAAKSARVQASTAGSSDLRYNTDNFVFNWKTDKAWAGSCRQLIVQLVDGSSHSLTFQFR